MSEAKVCDAHNIKMYRPECSRCHGESEVEDDDDLFTFRPNFARCWSCAGSGVAPYWECEICTEEAMEAEYREERTP